MWGFCYIESAYRQTRNKLVHEGGRIHFGVLWLEDGRGLRIRLTSTTGHVVGRGLPGA